MKALGLLSGRLAIVAAAHSVSHLLRSLRRNAASDQLWKRKGGLISDAGDRCRRQSSYRPGGRADLSEWRPLLRQDAPAVRNASCAELVEASMALQRYSRRASVNGTHPVPFSSLAPIHGDPTRSPERLPDEEDHWPRAALV